MKCEFQQAPAQQQTNRQTADITEKDLCDRAIEWRESDHCTAERGSDNRSWQRQLAEPSQQNHCAGDRYSLGNSHQVQPVHEIDEVHEPEARKQKKRSFDRQWTRWNDSKIGRSCKDDRADGGGLQQQARQYRDGFKIIGKSQHRDEQRRGENRSRDGLIHNYCDNGRDRQCRSDHCNSCPLRGR